METNNISSNSPIARLPIEVLSKIFEDYVDLPPHRLWPPHPRLFAARPDIARKFVEKVDRPFELRCVCRHWQAVVESTPNLWTCNRITGGPEGVPEILDHAARQIRWSGDHLPLSLYIACRTWGREGIEALVVFLHRYASRWHHLHLNVPSEFFNLLVEPKAITFPSLKTLSLAAEVYFAGVKWLIGPTSFPNMTTFRFYDEWILEVEAPNLIGWANLTTIDVEVLYLSEILGILHQAHQLAHFRIATVLNDPHESVDIPDSQIVHLPSLKSLDVGDPIYGQRACLKLLNQVKTPRLKRLRCIARFFKPPELVDCITQLFDRSGCSLDILILIQHDKEPSLCCMDEPARRLQAESSHLVLIDGTPIHPASPDIWGDHWGHLCSHCFYGEVQLYSDHSCPPSVRHIPPSI